MRGALSHERGARALPEHVRYLLRPSAYPHPVDQVELRQTHISYVLLAGAHAYKLKKARDLGFVDYSTLERRRLFCEEEVRLNTRTCGSTYLGVLPVARRGRGYALGGEGEVVDWAVHMRRLPEERMLSSLLERGEVPLAMIGRLAAALAGFHAAAEGGPRARRIGGIDTFRERWQENFDQTRPYIGKTIGRARFERLQRHVDGFMASRRALLEEREAEGRVRECHGDLRSDSVCFDPAAPGGLCIYDCIEFSERFRFTDTALDVAFLAMDLEFRGRRDLADLLAGLYAAAAGDKTLTLALEHYKCYRAYVRGKVESLLLAEMEVPRAQRAAARRRAPLYFRLAETCARRRPYAGAVLVMGLTGSGKSVLAGALAAHMGTALLATDIVRKEAAGLAPTAPRSAPLGEGLYAPEERRRTYEELCRQAEAFLARGDGAVLDGTYVERAERERVAAMTGRLRRPLLVVECVAPEGVIEERQRRRQEEPWRTSDARWEVYLAQKGRYEAPDEVPAGGFIRVDTTLPIEAQIETIVQRLMA